MWYIYTVVYYSVMKMNEIMPFAATQMQLEIIILGETNQKEKEIPAYLIFNSSQLLRVPRPFSVPKGGNFS